MLLTAQRRFWDLKHKPLKFDQQAPKKEEPAEVSNNSDNNNDATKESVSTKLNTTTMDVNYKGFYG